MTENNQQEIEIWKDVPGYEGSYQVSSLGNVKRLKKVKILKTKTKTLEEKELRPRVYNLGYKRFC